MAERPVTQVWALIQSWMDSQRFPVSQSALAKDIGVQRSAVSQWKYGDSRPTPDNMRAIQSATGIRYRDLLDALLADEGYLPTPSASGIPFRTDAPDPDAYPGLKAADDERRPRPPIVDFTDRE